MPGSSMKAIRPVLKATELGHTVVGHRMTGYPYRANSDVPGATLPRGLEPR